MKDELQQAAEKWQHYEREYILPCFDKAKKLGIDLEKLVRDNPGRNCVDLFIEARAKAERDAIEEWLEKEASTFILENPGSESAIVTARVLRYARDRIRAGAGQAQ